MASHSFIFQGEAAVKAAAAQVKQMREAFAIECNLNDGTPYRENKEVWDELYNSLINLDGEVQTGLGALEDRMAAMGA